MGQTSRRRKGKSTSRSSTPTAPSIEIESDVDNPDKIDHNTEKIDDNVEKSSSLHDSAPNSSMITTAGNVVPDEESLLVLTSEKKRGIYECDYCHSDISQQPRIRCAVCSDFDLCLDCFATSDHEAVMARIKAATETQTELTNDGIDSSSIVGIAISSAAATHEVHHQYRVCDSTRYPMFPTGRIKREETSDTISMDGTDTSSTPDNNKTLSFHISLSEDPKTTWTAEEDLRLIDAISTHGLGNWVDVAEAIGGQGSVGKTPKRCMERYLDDYLGRYGHILPQWTLVDNTVEDITGVSSVNSNLKGIYDKSGCVDNASNDSKMIQDSSTSVQRDSTTSVSVSDPSNEEKGQPSSEQKLFEKEGNQIKTIDTATPAKNASSLSLQATTNASSSKISIEEEEGVRTSKRRSGTTGISVTGSGRTSSQKKRRVVFTESLPDYDEVWPSPYLPETLDAMVGKEVARDQSCKAELAFVKSTLAAPSKKEADKIRQTWIDRKLGRIGSPTVLPPRPHDAIHLLGSELAGFMPRRGDFDVEWENDAESSLADMEFIRGDRPEDKELKLKVLQIYCKKLDEREKRKKFVLNRQLFDYRKYVQNDLQLPQDERDLVHRMRLFERFHTPDEHKNFIIDILKAKRLRKEIAKLQMYRRIGIRSLAEAEMYELDKDRRQFHKKLEGDAKAKAASPVKSKGTTTGTGFASKPLVTETLRTFSQAQSTGSLWKQYRTNDRKNRRNSSRSGSATDSLVSKTAENGVSNDDDTKVREDRKVNQTENTIIEDKEAPVNYETKAGASKIESTSSSQKTFVADNQNESTGTIVEDRKEFSLCGDPCGVLLSRKESALCERQHILPTQYLEIKKALINESLSNGLLEKNSASPNCKRSIVKIDVERRGDIIEFLVRAGWISRKLGEVAMRVVTPQPQNV